MPHVLAECSDLQFFLDCASSSLLQFLVRSSIYHPWPPAHPQHVDRGKSGACLEEQLLGLWWAGREGAGGGQAGGGQAGGGQAGGGQAGGEQAAGGGEGERRRTSSVRRSENRFNLFGQPSYKATT